MFLCVYEMEVPRKVNILRLKATTSNDFTLSFKSLCCCCFLIYLYIICPWCSLCDISHNMLFIPIYYLLIRVYKCYPKLLKWNKVILFVIIFCCCFLFVLLCCVIYYIPIIFCIESVYLMINVLYIFI